MQLKTTRLEKKAKIKLTHRELNPVLCDNLEGWDGVGGGREAQKGGDICIHVADTH